MRRPRRPLERRERPALAADRHVPHPSAGLGSGVGRDHLVVAKQRAVEEDDVGPLHAFAHGGRNRGRARNIDQPRPACVHLHPDGAGAFAHGLGIFAFQIKRHLAGNGEQLGLKAAGKRTGLAEARSSGARRRRGRAHRTRCWLPSTANVSADAYSVKAWRSRKLSRPATWSISPPVRSTALIGLPRVSPRGCKGGERRSCSGRSGDALIRSQSSPFAEMARLACVRGLTRRSPAHANRQTGQRQFHCGNPPPAAEPSTMAVRRRIPLRAT